MPLLTVMYAKHMKERSAEDKFVLVLWHSFHFGRNLRFPGVDNTESERYGVAIMLIEHLGRFSRF